MKLISCVTVLLCLIELAQCYYITVDAHSEEVFYEKTKTGTKMTLTFEVTEGGFLDIDVVVTGPDDKTMYKGIKETNGKYTLTAHRDGVYKFIFSNKMSSRTPKVVMFTIEMGAEVMEAENQKERDDNKSKLEAMIQELSLAMTSVKREQEYMEVRERIHRAVNDSTNSRVVMWAFFESLVLIAMTLGQILYLKRFFEVRRVI